MQVGWRLSAFYLLTASEVFGLARQLPGKAQPTLYGSCLIRRGMSSEVMEDHEFGPTDQSWIELLGVSISKSRKIRGSNYVQISTVNKDGEPRCRTVVFRGFLNSANLPEEHSMSPQNGGYAEGKPCVMKMCTDLRSKKVGEVAHQPISEMVRSLCNETS